MNEIRHPVIKLIFIAVFFVFSIAILHTIPRLFEMVYDPQLEMGIVAMGGPLPDLKPPNPIYQFLVKTIAKLVHPPSIYLGIDPPPRGFSRATLHQKYFQVITSRSATVPSLNPQKKDFLSPLRHIPILTSNPLVFGKFHTAAPNITLIPDIEMMKDKVRKQKNTVAIVPIGKIDPEFKSLSPPFLVSYWVGWKENTRWDFLGVNSQVLNTAETLISHAQREYRTRILELQIVDDVIQFNLTGTENVINLAHPKYMTLTQKRLAEQLLDWKHQGKPVVGAGFNHVDAASPLIYQSSKGTKVGIVAYSQIIPKGGLPTASQAGINFFTNQKMEIDLARLCKDTDIQIVIVSWNWRPQTPPLKNQRLVAYQAIDLGADIFIGISDQKNRSTEWRKGRFIAFNLGGEPNKQMLKATFQGSTLLQADIERAH